MESVPSFPTSHPAAASPTSPNAILARLLERLYATLVGGPSLNCRPHRSRQRVDLAGFGALGDPAAAIGVVPALLGGDRQAEILARVSAPRGLGMTAAEAATTDHPAADHPLSGEERAAAQAFERQDRLLAKLGDIAADARDYEQDHGESALFVGYPLLHLPPGTGSPAFGGSGGRTAYRSGGGTRTKTPRVLAPLALIPVELVVRRGPGTPSVTLKVRGSGGADLLLPNPALLAWIEQQTGRDTSELFADETGAEPWREIAEIVRLVAESLRLELPAAPFGPETSLAAAPGAGGDERAPGAVPGRPEEADGRGGNLAVEGAEPPTPSPAMEVATTTARMTTVAGPSFLPAAVLGLFPVTNQGLLRDLKAMAAGEVPLAGTPAQSFLSLDLDADPVATAAPSPPPSSRRAVVSPTQQRLVSPADPCQTRAVRLAREAPLLVVHGPPGTGKSQTITNVIGDHLARGERVLFVCDKRTALDVVRYRLDALGLGDLCAVVHDPQRDGRPLYKKLREQLENLADRRPPPIADTEAADLDALDADLDRLHVELTECHRALLEPTTEGGKSFHQLVGEWLVSPDDFPGGPLTASDVGELSLAELQSAHADLTEVLERAGKIRYAENPWVEVASAEVSLPDFLARPIAGWRERLARVTAAAARVDAETPGGNGDGEGLTPLPALDPVLPLPEQADAREALAARLDDLAAVRPMKVLRVAAERWVAQPDAAVRAVLSGFENVVATRQQLDADTVAGSPPPDPTWLASTAGRALPDLLRDRATLRAYDAAARTFLGRWFPFSNPKRGAARAVAAGFGAGLDAETSARLGAFLDGRIARWTLADFARRTLGATATALGPEGSLPADADLSRTLDAHRALLDTLAALGTNPALTGLAPDARRVLLAAGDEGDDNNTVTAGARLGRYANALRASARRARTLAAFGEEIARGVGGGGLLSAGWLADQGTLWRAGEKLAPTFGHLETFLPTVESFLRLRQTLARLPEALRTVTDARLLGRGVLAPGTTFPALRRAVLARDISRRLSAEPTLQNVDGERVDALFARYAELAARKREAVRDAILVRWTRRQRERLLAATGTQLNGVGAALKRRLVTRGERAMKLRQVLAQGAATNPGGDPLFDLCPVWMASPATVAQVFPREAIFDCVVFDEASQCRLEEALPVLLRARRVVVAGDPKQLPPTRFFESAVTESQAAADAETDQELFEQQQGETEDLLSAALNLQVQQSYLDVHYRSRHEALIGFSNANFYDRRLQAIPGHPRHRARVCPVTLTRVDGTYEKRTNRREAEAAVALVKDLLARPEPPSVGVACFNLTQRQLILELLDEATLADPDFAARLATARARRGAGSFEGLFVKNLENVQGDERDHLIVSTTFGPDEKGRFRRNFGPLGQAGGGRRLNVLVTRAREMVHVLTSIPRGEYVATTATLPELSPGEGRSPGGRWLLYAYLRYAEELAAEFAASSIGHRPRQAEATGASDQTVSPPSKEGEVRVRPGSESASPLVQAFAVRLAREHGLSSDVYWGNEGFGVDVALRHPSEEGMVTAGVLCDLTRFQQVEDPIEWELFRLAVHQSQGWRLERVWSPALFRDPEGVSAAVAASAARVAAEERLGAAPATEREAPATSSTGE